MEATIAPAMAIAPPIVADRRVVSARLIGSPNSPTMAATAALTRAIAATKTAPTSTATTAQTAPSQAARIVVRPSTAVQKAVSEPAP